MKIAVLGCASIANRLGPVLRADPAFELTAVVSRTAERAAEFARKFECEAITGYERLLCRDDIEAVYVPLPTGLHFDWIRACLSAGKHVLAEKSLTTSASRTLELVRLAEKKSLVLLENFGFLHHRMHDDVRRRVADGLIGDLRAFDAEFAFLPRAADDIRYQRDLGGGALLDAGAYTVRCAQSWLGSELDVIGAFAGIDNETGVDVRGSALLVGAEAVPAQLSYGFDHSYRCHYTLWGTRGSLRVDRAFTAPAGFAPRFVFERDGETEEITGPSDDRFAAIARHFARLIDGTEDPAAEYAAAVRQAELLEDITRTAYQLGCAPLHPKH